MRGVPSTLAIYFCNFESSRGVNQNGGRQGREGALRKSACHGVGPSLAVQIWRRAAGVKFRQNRRWLGEPRQNPHILRVDSNSFASGALRKTGSFHFGRKFKEIVSGHINAELILEGDSASLAKAELSENRLVRNLDLARAFRSAVRFCGAGRPASDNPFRMASRAPSSSLRRKFDLRGCCERSFFQQILSTARLGSGAQWKFGKAAANDGKAEAHREIGR